MAWHACTIHLQIGTDLRIVIDGMLFIGKRVVHTIPCMAMACIRTSEITGRGSENFDTLLGSNFIKQFVNQ